MIRNAIIYTKYEVEDIRRNSTTATQNKPNAFISDLEIITHVIESSGKIRLVRMQFDEDKARNSTCHDKLQIWHTQKYVSILPVCTTAAKYCQ